MNTAVERRKAIVELIHQAGQVRVEELAARFQVSSVTIRSDLSLLERKGYVLRSHGCAIPNHAGLRELSQKDQSDHALDSQLGQAAARMVLPGDRILLGTGPAIMALCRELKGTPQVNAMTHGLDEARELRLADGVSLMLTGGRLSACGSYLEGPVAEQSLNNFRFDKLFLQIDSLDLRAGLTCSSESLASLLRQMCRLSRSVILLLNANELGQQHHHWVLDTQEIDCLVTNMSLPGKVRSELAEHDIELVLVESVHQDKCA